jgi:RNA polymerase sigma-70 factor, ECF subfamily
MPRKPPSFPDPFPEPDPSSAARAPAEGTVELLQRIRTGDSVALDRLCERYLPRLRRWATGRLPRRARDLLDTDDLVQDTVIKTLRRLRDFVPRHDGALQAYLRQVLLNRIRDEARRVSVRPTATTLDVEGERDPGPSPLEEVVGRECMERYEAAFARLGPDDQQAIVLRIELDYDYRQIAEALDKPSSDAARMAVSRALVRLAREMGRGT